MTRIPTLPKSESNWRHLSQPDSRARSELEEITKRRGFANSTIETHIAKLIEEGKQIDWHQFVTEEQFQLCTELFAKHGDEALAPIIEAAQGKLGYGHAKIVRAIMSCDQD